MLNMVFDFRVVIHASQAIVDLTVKKGDLDILTLRNVAADCVRKITDLVGYKQGCCFDVEIVSAICRDTSDWTVFGTEVPTLAARRAAEQVGAVDIELIRATTQSAAAQIVLADFREAIRVPIGTGFYCYRAIEAMMQSMKARAEDPDGPAWQQLRDRLRIDRSAIDEVKLHADFPRHGKPSGISDAESARVFELTDQIIGRFLVYLANGKAPLTEQDFPVLAS
jgi:hypothetical protein